MSDAANEAFNVSQREVPVKTGTLRASGAVGQPTVTGMDAEVAIGYGGAAKAYALKQHEDLNLNHPNGKAKYLEDPVRAQTDGMAERIAKRLKEVLATL